MEDDQVERPETQRPERRSTTEAIALIFTVTVALVILAAIVIVGIAIYDDNDAPTNQILSALGAVINTMLGALIVYVAGGWRRDS